NGHGGTESSRAFDEGSETEGHDQQLKPPIGRDAGHGLFHNLELAGFNGDVVEIDGGDHDPDNLQQTKAGAIKKTGQGQPGGHSKSYDCAEDRCGCAGDRANVGGDAESGEQSEKNQN